MATELFPAGADDVLYLVDLSGYVFRAYHAVAPLTSPSGEPTHAVVGTVNMLEQLVRERRPRLLAIAMDAGRDTFRKAIYDGYKANRPPAPDDLRVQMRRVQQIVEAFAIPVFRDADVEADDLIATAVRRARAEGLRVVIVSGDKDLMQLVSADVLLWDTMKNRVFGVAEAEERFGVRVDQIRDLLALMGDTSDNVPGVPSVGPKTARDLLQRFDTLDGIYEHLGEVGRKKLEETLATHREQALLSRTLVTLKDDCDVEFSRERLSYGGRDVAALRAIYAELGFQRQIAALPADDEGPTSAKTPGRPRDVAAPTYTLVLDETGLAELVRTARATGRVALALATSSPDAVTADIIGVALATAPGVAAYVPVGHRYVGMPRQLPLPRVLSALGPVLADEQVKKAAHDTKRVAVVLARSDVVLDGVAFDSMLASYLLDPSASHDLVTLAKAELRMDLPSYDSLTNKRRGHQLQMDEVSAEDALGWAAASADAALRSWEVLEPRLHDSGLGPLFRDVELPLATLLARMELTGVLVDDAFLRRLGASMETEIAALEAEAHRVAGKPFNVNSPRQLETLLFDELGLSPLKRTKTSRSTDAATLEALAEQHELPRVVLEHRQLAKLKGTYVDALPALVNPRTGRIHTRWEQAVAATGRLSSVDPNLQNIPIRTERGRAIRGAFVAPEGHVLMSADYSQIELRVLAHLSKDPVLIDAFRSGQDIHLRTAMEIFEVGADDVTREHRSRAKAVNFGVIYGQGDSGLAKSLAIERAEAARFIAAYFRRYEGVRRFMEETLARARAGNAVTTLFGRTRPVPDIRNPNRARRLAAERIAMNTPIQGTAADLLKMAMLKLREPVVPGARMILTVHDELVFEVPAADAERAAATVKAAMESVHPLDVPLVVDVGFGPTWNDAH